ncbi:MAG: hypothetical protein PF487_11050 [Bacteroidales bacterium]|jgi:hypothetical protein|nr:hypothetical protein [Bacteroidales bacterium]
MELPIWQYIVSMLVYIIFLLVMIEVMRKNYKFAAIFWLLSLLTFPLWFSQLEGWFRWVKTISVLIPTAMIVGLSRISVIENRTGWWKNMRKDWVLWTLYGVLGLNILEASLKDIALGNYFNAISGFILIATIPLVNRRKKPVGKYHQKNRETYWFTPTECGIFFTQHGILLLYMPKIQVMQLAQYVFYWQPNYILL